MSIVAWYGGSTVSDVCVCVCVPAHAAAINCYARSFTQLKNLWIVVVAVVVAFD